MIDYSLLNYSLIFYEERGFKRIEAPWTVSSPVDDITRPEQATKFQLKHNNKCLVASGEQSFLYLYLKGFLPPGKFQTITPCFRSDSFDLTHTKYFMKNEIIITEEPNEKNLEQLIDQSIFLFNKLVPGGVEKVKEGEGYDIVSKINGVELGSYGIRRCEYLTWIYGTGLAEPRTSTVIQMLKNNGISF